MQRRINPWVAFLTAALTFGSLVAFVGHGRLANRWSGPYDKEHRFQSGDDCRASWREARPSQPQSSSITQ